MLKTSIHGTGIAIDYGLKRIGIACGEASIQTAHPLTTIHEIHKHKKIESIQKIIKEWNPKFLVMGLPFHSDGSKNEFTQTCKNFAFLLAKKTHLPVYLVDERYSSCYAEELLKENKITGIKKNNCLIKWLQSQF